MPIQHAIWQVGAQPLPLANSKLASEQLLEDMIVRDPRILSSDWMLIGRQEITTFGGRIDLLAIAPDGSLVLIELKRDRTPREIVAQALDYASWLPSLTGDRLVQIYSRFRTVAAWGKHSANALAHRWMKMRSIRKIRRTRSSSQRPSSTLRPSGSSNT